MGKAHPQLEAIRKAYREALEQARANPTAESWTNLLAAGKALSSAQENKRSRRHPQQTPTLQEIESAFHSAPDAHEPLE